MTLFLQQEAQWIKAGLLVATIQCTMLLMCYKKKHHLAFQTILYLILNLMQTKRRHSGTLHLFKFINVGNYFRNTARKNNSVFNERCPFRHHSGCQRKQMAQLWLFLLSRFCLYIAWPLLGIQDQAAFINSTSVVHWCNKWVWDTSVTASRVVASCPISAEPCSTDYWTGNQMSPSASDWKFALIDAVLIQLTKPLHSSSSCGAMLHPVWNTLLFL